MQEINLQLAGTVGYVSVTASSLMGACTDQFVMYPCSVPYLHSSAPQEISLNFQESVPAPLLLLARLLTHRGPFLFQIRQSASPDHAGRDRYRRNALAVPGGVYDEADGHGA